MNVLSPNIKVRESGAALIVVLVMLIVVTLLGLASMRGVLMQERMAANTAARAVAFQGAEAGLRQAEVVARDGGLVIAPKTNPSDAQTCNNGICTNPGTTTPLWQSQGGFWENTGAGWRAGTTVGSGNTAVTPRFIIEDMGRAVVMGTGTSSGSIDASIAGPATTSNRQNIYRITSRAATATGAEVVLQTIYRR